jgi:hypothetical protein
MMMTKLATPDGDDWIQQLEQVANGTQLTPERRMLITEEQEQWLGSLTRNIE